MDKVLRHGWWLLSLAVVGNGLGLGWCTAQDAFGPFRPQKPSISTSVKEGFSKMGKFIVPKSTPNSIPSDDPTSLKANSKASPELHVAIARYYEQKGQIGEAEQKYQQALKKNPENLLVLLSYARMKENLGQHDTALTLYRQAVKMHPRQATAYNFLGLCYERHNLHSEAAAEIIKAVQLAPRSVLYRNNLAAVLVELNRHPEAFATLRKVHGDAAAYYNLGYLLQKKGDLAAAEHHFRRALWVDPTLAPAKRWAEYLHKKGRAAPLAQPTPPTRQPTRVAGLPETPYFPARRISPRPENPPYSAPPGSPAMPINPVSPRGRGVEASLRAQSAAPPGSTSPLLAAPTRQLRPVRVPRTPVNPPLGVRGYGVPQNFMPPSGTAAPVPRVPPNPPALQTPTRLPPISARRLRNSPKAENSDIELTTHLEDGTDEVTPFAPLPPE